MTRLKLLRLNNNLSQMELAHKAKISRWNLQQFEVGIKKPTEDQVKMLSFVLRSNPKTIMEEVE